MSWVCEPSSGPSPAMSALSSLALREVTRRMLTRAVSKAAACRMASAKPTLTPSPAKTFRRPGPSALRASIFFASESASPPTLRNEALALSSA